MAKLDVQGFNAFEADFEAAKNLTKGEIRTILAAGAEVLKERMKQTLVSIGLVDKGTLRDSIRIYRKTESGHPIAEVRPSGTHHMAHGWGPRRGRTMGRGKGAAYPVSNERLGFVLEYGAPYRGINAWHWVETATLRANVNGELDAAMQNAFNEVLDANGVGQ